MRIPIIVAALALLASPALAEPGKGKANGWKGQGQGKHYGHIGRDAPLPLAAGLPALAMIGGAVGFAWAARRREDSK